MGFCSCTVKYLLFAFNFIIVLLSIALIVIGSLSFSNGNKVSNILDGKVSAPSIAIIVIGVIIFLLAFFGCCGAIQENVCMVSTYGILLLVLLVIEIVIAVFVFYYHTKFESEFGKGIVKLFEDYRDSDTSQQVVDSIQKTFHCCGVDGPSYWSSAALPESCCKNPSGILSKCALEESWTDGCRGKLVGAIKYLFTQMGIVSIVIACIQVVGVVFAFFLANKIRNDDRRGYY